jgi:hypothetical protein
MLLPTDECFAEEVHEPDYDGLACPKYALWDSNSGSWLMNIQPTVPYGGGSVIVWGCISHDFQLDLVTMQGNLTGDQYIRDPTDECFAEEVHEPDYDGLACPKYALWDSNSGSWLAKEQKSLLCFGASSVS